MAWIVAGGALANTPSRIYPLFGPLVTGIPCNSHQAIVVANKSSAPFHVPCKNGPLTPNPCQQCAPFNAPSTFILLFPAMHCSCSKHLALPSNIPAIHLAIPCHQTHPHQAFHSPSNIPAIHLAILCHQTHPHVLPWMLI